MNEQLKNKKSTLLISAKEIQKRSKLFGAKALTLVLISLTLFRFPQLDFNEQYVFNSQILLAFILTFCVASELRIIYKLLSELIEFMCESQL